MNRIRLNELLQRLLLQRTFVLYMLSSVSTGLKQYDDREVVELKAIHFILRLVKVRKENRRIGNELRRHFHVGGLEIGALPIPRSVESNHDVLLRVVHDPIERTSNHLLP